MLTSAGTQAASGSGVNPETEEESRLSAQEGPYPDTLQNASAEMLEEKRFLENLVASCPDGIIAVDRRGMIVLFNKAAESLTGHTGEEVIGRASIEDVYHPATLARQIKKRLYSEEFGGRGFLEDFEVEILTKEGRKVPIRLSASLLHRDGEEIGSVGFFHDLTAQKRMEARLREISITDELTGLYNRRHFFHVLSDELTRATRYRRPLSLIAIDLDNFKTYNDTLGHLEGDGILKSLGQTLLTVPRKTDKAFRSGGDEFMVVLPETDLTNAIVTAERIRKGFLDRWPHGIPDLEFDITPPTLSLGIAEASGEPMEHLIKRADLTMYEAKRAGGNQSRTASARIGKAVVAQDTPTP